MYNAVYSFINCYRHFFIKKPLKTCGFSEDICYSVPKEYAVIVACALQKDTLGSTEIHEYLLDVRFDLLYGRLAGFPVLEIGAEQTVIM